MAVPLEDKIPDVPPSAKLVAKTLEHEGELTQTEIQTRTGLPERTVRNALGNLDEKDALRTRQHYHDGRKKWYDIPDEWREDKSAGGFLDGRGMGQDGRR